jgi:hypothetical protein
VCDLQFIEQPLGCGDFVGFLLDIDMRQDHAGPDVECV